MNRHLSGTHKECPYSMDERKYKNFSELIGTVRSEAEACGYFTIQDIVSLHCLSGRMPILVHKECILTAGRMVILFIKQTY